MATPPANQRLGRTGPPPTVPDHELLCQIGLGSYGEVWIARGITGSLRAVKIVHQQSFESPRPYEREFQGISHFEPISRADPGLVDILQVGRSPENTSFYYVMELADDANGQAVDGAPRELTPGTYEPLTLETLLRKEGGRLPVPCCVQMAMALGRGLAYLHKAGLVHRDIKPSNIIFVGGVPKLADVGLVARLEERKSFVGTEGFVPPEGPGTACADIYALGKCLYEAAMGRDRQDFPSPPTQLHELPDRHELLEFNEIITKACDPDPALRYQDGTEMLAELELLADGRSVRGARIRHARLRGLAWAAAALIAVAATTFAWHYFRLLPSDPRVSRHPAYRLLVREVRLPFIGNQHAGFVQFDSDPEPELLLASRNSSIAVVTLDGHLVFSHDQTWEYPNLNYGLCVDVDGDGVDEWFATYGELDHLVGAVFNSTFYEIKRFEFPNDVVRTPAGDERVAFLRSYGVLPASGNRPGAALFAWGHGSTNFPRHLVCLDWASRSELWRYPISGHPQNILFRDLDNDGELDLLFATGAPDNGYTNDRGRNDSTVYLTALRRDGTEMWCHPFAPKFCPATVYSAKIAGAEQIYALGSRDTMVRAASGWQEPGFARLARVEASGKIAASWQGTNHLYDLGWAALAPGANTNLYAPDSDGCLNIFDPLTLQLLRRVQITKPSADWVQLRLIGIADLDGDGFQEVALGSQQFDHISGTNLGHPEEPRNVERTLDNRVVVLDHNLCEVAAFTVSPLRKDPSSLNTAIVENQLLKCREIAVIEDRALFLRLKHLDP